MASCLTCKIEFGVIRNNGVNRKFCGSDCRNAYWRGQYAGLNPRSHILKSPNAVGSLHEMEVACDLLRSGYEVFKALNNGSSCDLAILRDGKLIRVEVTTGTRTPSGKVLRPKKNSEKYDILAIVFYDGEIVYEPKIEIFTGQPPVASETNAA